jgi:hypothetical protein
MMRCSGITHSSITPAVLPTGAPYAVVFEEVKSLCYYGSWRKIMHDTQTVILKMVLKQRAER